MFGGRTLLPCLKVKQEDALSTETRAADLAINSGTISTPLISTLMTSSCFALRYGGSVSPWDAALCVDRSEKKVAVFHIKLRYCKRAEHILTPGQQQPSNNPRRSLAKSDKLNLVLTCAVHINVQAD